MKNLFIILSILFSWVAALTLAFPCYAFMPIKSGVCIGSPGEAGGETPTPTWSAGLDDDAGNQTVVATVGSNGQVYPVGTDGYTNLLQNDTALTEGTGSFTFPENDQCVYTPVLTGSEYEDGQFTVQATFYFDSGQTITGSGYNPRLFSSSVGDLLIYMANSDTDLVVVYDGTTQTTLTIDDIADSNNHVIRVVFNEGGTPELAVYQGATEAALTLKDSNATFSGAAAPTYTDIQMRFGGAPVANQSIGILSSNRIDDLKLWNTAVTP